ncbi:recombination regulator RecX [Lacticaseibacillus nasuensis]|uniref:recombination regulator RecX n=1 Tax=Lacticaseibacillus nasuensis TaxID=944671 RepID=UPI002245BAB6|nr:recombination regulator RecX [Lacticaseibacillus nasuensis]MCX2455347.1 recombination regulator RecX [Lacticaseibacillus nasuensis]
MPKITAITTQKRRGRYNIFIDGHYAFPVSEQSLIQFRLSKGQELTPALEQAIKAAEVTASANTLALDYLSHQSRTVHELRQHLAEAELPPDAIDAAVTRLTELHYLDDAAYARAYVNDNLLMGERGPKAVMQVLTKKGVAKDIQADVLAAVTSAQWAAVALRVAAKAAKHNQRRAYHDAVARIKLAVLQKGFNADAAAAALAELDFQPDPAGEADRLATEAAKQWRLKRKYTGYDRRQRVKQALYRKGYDLTAIDTALAELTDD